MGVNIFHRRSSSTSLPPSSRRKYPSTPFSRNAAPDAAQPGNPDPNNWRLVKAEEYSGYLIVEIKYPNCTNYEGNKILLFEEMKLVDLVNQRLIDPHFFQDSRYKSPIVRFEPTERGWMMARKLVSSLAK